MAQLCHERPSTVTWKQPNHRVLLVQISARHVARSTGRAALQGYSVVRLATGFPGMADREICR